MSSLFSSGLNTSVLIETKLSMIKSTRLGRAGHTICSERTLPDAILSFTFARFSCYASFIKTIKALEKKSALCKSIAQLRKLFSFRKVKTKNQYLNIRGCIKVLTYGELSKTYVATTSARQYPAEILHYRTNINFTSGSQNQKL